MLRRCVVLWCLAFSLLLWGCATQPAAKPTGAMLVVRLLSKQDPTERITLQVTQGDKAVPMALVNGIPYSRITGRSIDYLFPVPLAPGPYKISTGSGLPPFEMTFEVPAGAPAYVGRLLLSPDSPPMLEDRSTEDVPMLRNAVARLRSVAIATQIGSLRQLPSPELARGAASGGAVEVSPAAQAVRAAASGGSLEVVPVTDALAGELPAASQQAFKRYLRLREPRAFALEDEGAAYGAASGKDAIERAIQQCNKLGPKKPCRLFSVNQTATLWRRCTELASNFQGWLRLADVEPQDAAKGTPVCPRRR